MTEAALEKRVGRSEGGGSRRAVSAVPAAYRHCAGVTRRSGSSFAAAFWMLPRAQRRALHALYAFCRLADDIADDPDVRGDREELLGRWRGELEAAYRGKSRHPVGIALGDAVNQFRLPEFEFEELLRGVEWDLGGAPIETWSDLELYCDRVASTVGRLIVRVLGSRGPESLAYATAMGRGVQLTNILRDVGEDARSGRIYLAREDLQRFGVEPDDVFALRSSDAMKRLLAHYAEQARIQYDRADALRPAGDRRLLRPADAMGRIYRTLLDELERRRLPCLEESVRLSRQRRLAIAAGVYLGW